MNKNLVKELLLTRNYWVLNKCMVSWLGLESAFLLSCFAEAEKMMADEDGYFYQTFETVEKITTLSRHKQTNAIKQLEELGILKKELRGAPPKRYFKIEYSSLANQFAENQQIETLKISKSIRRKSATIKNIVNKESIHKESMKDIADLKVDTVEKNDIPYLSIVSYLNHKTERQFKATTRTTRNFIKARLNEGFTLQDFCQVIDIKTKQWLGDPEMNQYLRPETLFGTKFESYLNQKEVVTNQEKQLMKLQERRENRQPEYEVLGDADDNQ